jgi:hypothetical protein
VPRPSPAEALRVATEALLEKDPLSASWVAAEELQAAAEHFGNLEESQETKWFFEGLRRGFEKKAHKQEEAALRQQQFLSAEAHAEAAALARCREELQEMRMTEQRAALEVASASQAAAEASREVLSASQVSREEMTLMVAEVAESRQRATEELSQLRDSFSKEYQRLTDSLQDSSFSKSGANGSQSGANSSGSQMQDHALFKDVRLPLYSEEHLRSMSSSALREHARHIRVTLGSLVVDVPEADPDVVDWILEAQHEHLEILPELEKFLAASEEIFESSPSPSQPTSMLQNYVEASNGKSHEQPDSPTTTSRQTVDFASPNADRASPVKPRCQPSLLSSPLMANRFSPTSSPQPFESPATSNGCSISNSGLTPCGSARKLPDNDVRTLTPAAGMKHGWRTGLVRS